MNKDIKTIDTIERAHGISLQRLDKVLGDENGYSLDADGRVDALALVDCAINDLTPLAGLQSLTNLCLENNDIDDVAPLANLPGLL